MRPPLPPQAPTSVPALLSDAEIAAREEWLARCFPQVPDAWFRTLWVLFRLMKEDRRDWRQMTPESFRARGTHLKESAQREALREMARVNLIEKVEGQAPEGRQGPNWLRLNPEQAPEAVDAVTKKRDQRPVRTPVAKKAPRAEEHARTL